jgi:acyl carrier protein
MARLLPHAAPAEPAPASEPAVAQSPNRVLVRLETCLVESLNIDRGELAAEKSFADYGVDSISGVALINHINRVFGLTLKTTLLFDYPDLRSLADYIAANQVRQHVGETIQASELEFEEPEPTATDTEPAGRDTLRRRIEACLIDSLDIDRDDLSDEKNFADYGLDSITGVAMINQLNGDLGITLKTTVLFDYATPALLADFIQQQFGGQLNAPVAAGGDDLFGASDDSINLPPPEPPPEDEEGLKILRMLANGEVDLDQAEALMEAHS